MTAKEMYLKVAKERLSEKVYKLHSKGIVDDSIILEAMELYAQYQVKKLNIDDFSKYCNEQKLTTDFFTDNETCQNCGTSKKNVC